MNTLIFKKISLLRMLALSLLLVFASTECFVAYSERAPRVEEGVTLDDEGTDGEAPAPGGPGAGGPAPMTPAVASATSVSDNGILMPWICNPDRTTTGVVLCPIGVPADKDLCVCKHKCVSVNVPTSHVGLWVTCPPDTHFDEKTCDCIGCQIFHSFKGGKCVCDLNQDECEKRNLGRFDKEACRCELNKKDPTKIECGKDELPCYNTAIHEKCLKISDVPIVPVGGNWNPWLCRYGVDKQYCEISSALGHKFEPPILGSYCARTGECIRPCESIGWTNKKWDPVRCVCVHDDMYRCDNLCKSWSPPDGGGFGQCSPACKPGEFWHDEMCKCVPTKIGCDDKKYAWCEIPQRCVPMCPYAPPFAQLDTTTCECRIFDDGFCQKYRGLKWSPRLKTCVECPDGGRLDPNQKDRCVFDDKIGCLSFGGYGFPIRPNWCSKNSKEKDKVPGGCYPPCATLNAEWDENECRCLLKKGLSCPVHSEPVTINGKTSCEPPCAPYQSRSVDSGMCFDVWRLCDEFAAKHYDGENGRPYGWCERDSQCLRIYCGKLNWDTSTCSCK